MGNPPAVDKLLQTASRLLALLRLGPDGMPPELEPHNETNPTRVQRALADYAQACCNQWAADEAARYEAWEALPTAERSRKVFGPKPTKPGKGGIRIHLGFVREYLDKHHNADGRLN
jgi:hypothetical protein